MSLLSAEFMRELELLSRQLRRSRAAGDFGSQMARSIGNSPEFADRRGYAPNDDAKSIDWLAYARTGQAVVKRYHAEEGTLMRLVLDSSGSSGLPPKLDAQKRMAAAIGYAALAAGWRVNLIAAPGRDGDGLTISSERRGRGAAGGLFDDIERCSPEGGTAIASWVRRLSSVHRTRASIVLVSDLLDEVPFLRTLTAAVRRGLDISLVQVLTPEELHPQVGGDVKLTCMETGEELRLALDAHAVARYERSLFGWLSEVAEWARSNGQCYVRLSSDGDLSAAVRRFVKRSIDLP